MASGVLPGRWGTIGSMRATQAAFQLFSTKSVPDAIFVANDHMAIAVMDTLRQGLGLRVPDDVAIIGFDDVPQASWAAYGLTTIKQDANAMIEGTISLLLKQMASGNTHREDIVLPPRLIERTSARQE
jgi:DNA-binding LacI/PurR family transcriptional regulator